MAYCTDDELLAALSPRDLGELTDDVMGSVTIDPVISLKVRSDASDEIDRYLAGRYTTPVTDAASLRLLRPVCVTLCKFKLFARRDLNLEKDNSPTRIEYDRATVWLRDIQKGDASLPPTAIVPDPAEPSGDIPGVYGSQTAIFKDFYF